MKTKIGFKDQLSLNAGQRYCKMLQESILQYFRPPLSYHLSLRPLFCLLLSGCLRQVSLYLYLKRLVWISLCRKLLRQVFSRRGPYNERAIEMTQWDCKDALDVPHRIAISTLLTWSSWIYNGTLLIGLSDLCYQRWPIMEIRVVWF